MFPESGQNPPHSAVDWTTVRTSSHGELVEITCPICHEVREVTARQVRYQVRTGRFTGRCSRDRLVNHSRSDSPLLPPADNVDWTDRVLATEAGGRGAWCGSSAPSVTSEGSFIPTTSTTHPGRHFPVGMRYPSAGDAGARRRRERATVGDESTYGLSPPAVDTETRALLSHVSERTLMPKSVTCSTTSRTRRRRTRHPAVQRLIGRLWLANRLRIRKGGSGLGFS